MKNRSNEKVKIPFAFTPIPNFFFTSDIFSNANLVRFAMWAFYRTSFGDGEFIFGRERCSFETGISEQRIRTIINQLVNQDIIQKVTSKSTSRFTVYKWVWESFSCFCNQHSNIESTTNQPQTNHSIKNKKKEKEASRAAAFFSKNQKMLDSLEEGEKTAVLKLLNVRIKKQKIHNVDGWITECIKQGWHRSQNLAESELNATQIEENKKLAKEMLPQLQAVEGLQVCLRQDLLDIQWKKKKWQIFFYENANLFRKQLNSIMKLN